MSVVPVQQRYVQCAAKAAEVFQQARGTCKMSPNGHATDTISNMVVLVHLVHVGSGYALLAASSHAPEMMNCVSHAPWLPFFESNRGRS